MLHRYRIGYLIIGGLALIGFSATTAFASHSVTSYKWGSNTVQVDVSDPSWLSTWTSPLASAMSAWNNTPSSFTFQSGASGHQVTRASISPAYLALTTVYFTGTTINDADTTFNTYYQWSTSGESGKYDVQNISTHELGHWLHLTDLYGGGDTALTMYGNSGTGETSKRSLETDDVNAINQMYP